MTREHARTTTAVGCLAILAVAVASASVAVAQIAHAAKSDATVTDLPGVLLARMSGSGATWT